MPPLQGCEFNMCCNFSVSRMRVIMVDRSLDYIYKRHTFISVTEAFWFCTWSLDWKSKSWAYYVPLQILLGKHPSHLTLTELCGQQSSVQWWPLQPCWSAGHSQEDQLKVQWIRMRKWCCLNYYYYFLKISFPSIAANWQITFLG